MEKIIEFLSNNQEILISVGLFITGWLLPTPSLFKLGQKTKEKLPKKVTKEIVIKLEAFVQGLKDSHVDGNYNLVDNNKIDTEFKSLKKNLDL